MRILIEKTRVDTIFNFFQPVVTEPLELEYLKSSLESSGHEVFLVDKMFRLQMSANIAPELVILNGYNTAEDAMRERAAEYRKQYPNSLIAASGVHVQLNKEVFRDEPFDLVIHSGSIEAFMRLLDVLQTWDGKTPLEGADIMSGEDGIWILGNEVNLEQAEQIVPDRALFKRIRRKTRYLDKKDVALFKSGVGCPHDCSFCYCKALNGSKYLKSDYRRLFQEMTELSPGYCWIVDDILMKNEHDARSFIEASNEAGFSGSIIGYLRADFIFRNQSILKKLKKAGLNEAIVGFEAPFHWQLQDYNKEIGPETFRDIVESLKAAEIDLTALFIVDPGYTRKDFRELRSFIRELDIEVFTMSIFTPIKGTADYEEMKDKIIDHRSNRSDFLHLILPSKLPKAVFYMEFYLTHLRLLRSGRVWKYILKR